MPSDFDFLQGSFDVAGRRLRDPFDPGSSARWRQAFRVADGDRDENWEMRITRPAPEAVL